MGKRVLTIILSVLLVIISAYSVISTLANSELVDEVNSIESTCRTLTTRCEELFDENKLLKEGLYSETYVLDAAIGLIHPEAKGHKVENMYIAIAPLEAMGDVNTAQI